MRKLLMVVCFAATLTSHGGQAADTKTTVAVLNSLYGAVVTASLEGWYSKTLKIEWTAQTTKLHAIKVLAEVGSVKSSLYEDGVRYFKFPNDAGGFNVIDWKTGEKKSVSERTKYFFP